jgi:amidase/aspartyl-tRNA(Asn)/glutamyl-tRNA(Gln) amidotransferase subunit A
MVRMQDVTAEEMAAVAESLPIDLAAGEAELIAERTNALAPIYRDLEGAPAGAGGGGPAERMASRDAAPDPYNAWLARFSLTRPDADGPLSGVAVGVKDNMAVRGVELTCGSRAFEGVVPDRHAAVVDGLLAAGAEVAGKTNLDELAFGPTSETSAFGPVANPRDPDHVTGGSSAGSAAAVAAGEVDLALGSDTGGSIRIPASYCGIVGHKPTYGLVPLDGVVPLAYSMDHVGPLATDVETAARGLDAVADPAPGHETDYAADLGTDLSTLTVGVVERLFAEHVEAGVERTVRDAIGELADAGATVREVEIDGLERSREAWWGIAPAEFAATYATNAIGLWRRVDADPTLSAAMARVRRGSSRALGTTAKEMLALGGHLLETHDGHHYARAQRLRASLTAAFDAAFETVDLIASPATPTTALELGGFERGVSAPVNWDTHPTDLTGHPSISLPCGEADGLPVGLQLIGPRWDDGTVLDAAHEFETR